MNNNIYDILVEIKTIDSLIKNHEKKINLLKKEKLDRENYLVNILKYFKISEYKANHFDLKLENINKIKKKKKKEKENEYRSFLENNGIAEIEKSLKQLDLIRKDSKYPSQSIKYNIT